jgi:branched-chain amino acid transport system substrate-binding protein
LTVLRAALKDAGIALVDSESYKGGTQDFSAQLTKIRAASPDLLMMMSSSGPTFGYILKQMAELNFRPPTILTYVQVTDPQARQVAGDLVNGVYFIRLPVDPDWNAHVFRPRTGYDADLNGAISYDAIALYLAARATVPGDDREAIRDAMFNFKGYKGALGAWGYEGTHVTHVKFEAAQLLPDGSSVKVPF